MSTTPEEYSRNPVIMSVSGIDPLRSIPKEEDPNRIPVHSPIVQPSPVEHKIRINNESVDVSTLSDYHSIKPNQDNIIKPSENSPRLNVRSPARTRIERSPSPIKISQESIRSPKKAFRRQVRVEPERSVSPLDVPDGYVEGVHKIVDRIPTNPQKNVIYVNRRQRDDNSQIPHPATVSPLAALPKGVDERTVTIEELQNHARAKRLLLYKRIPVKFNESSMINWSKFSKEFKGRMYHQILQKYMTMIHSNTELLGNTQVYMMKFTSIEHLYSQYLHVKNIIDTQWMRGAIYTGLVLLYTCVGWYLDKFHDMNSSPVIALIIKHGISKTLINNLNISPDLTRDMMGTGGIPILWKFVGIIVINIFLVYLVCTLVDDENVQGQIGNVSRAVNDMAVEDRIGMTHVMQAGMPLANMIASRMGVNIGGLANMFGGTTETTSDGS